MGTAYKELFKLYDLIQNAETRSVKAFLSDTSIDINVIIPCKGIGLLHLAVGVDPLEKSKECTEVLLKHGGDPNLCNDDGVTPVHIAAIWGRVDNLRVLVGCGGDPGLQDLEGLSSFEYAAREQQWEVYDYLKNVVDDSDDSDDPQCAYTLDLDKILVTTDEIVAEYEPLTEDPAKANTTYRKSEMVRDWCDTNSLVVNKLYPTILSETYILEDESIAWNNRNITLDLTKNSKPNDDVGKTDFSNSSFKTCLSHKTVEVSGVKPLEATSSDSLKRSSVYENFSLPGSPQNVVHMNYNSKSSLRCKSQKSGLVCSNLCTVVKDKSLESGCCLDKALAVVQNRTNEWLSVDGNSRASSSSGVSSNYSAGSILIASVHEEYKYEDKEEQVVLIEKRLMLQPVVLPLDDACDGSPDQTVVSIASSLPTAVRYDDNSLRAELLRLGYNPGPILNSTRTLYLKKLHELKRHPIVAAPTDRKNDNRNDTYDDRTTRARLLSFGYNPGPIVDSTRSVYLKKLRELERNQLHVLPREYKNTAAPAPFKIQAIAYSIEMEKSLRSDEWMRALTPYEDLERKTRLDFAKPREWREGKSKTSFTYLLLDPRLTENLPARSQKTKLEMWTTFVNSIFYVGKGKRSRPYAHLYQALTLWKRGFTTSNDKKIQHILNIWQNQLGVVCLHIFQNVIPAEAFTYEAAMIDVIGITNLKNLKSGTYYGLPATWPHKERRMLGLYLLFKAMGIFLNEGERQLRPDDI